MVRTSVRVPKRQRMAWAVALAAGFVASATVFTNHPAVHVIAAAQDRAVGGGSSSSVVGLPAGFQRPSFGAAPQAGPGITVLAAPTDGNKALTVSETIRPGRPITSITLSPPQLPDGFDQGSVTIQNVVIVADGRTVVLDFTTLKSQRVVPLGTAAQTVTVSYTLSGVQKPGARNQLALKPITSVGDGVVLPVSFVVAARSTLKCPDLPAEAQSSCQGTGSGSAAVTMLAGLASTQAALVIDLAPTGPGTVLADPPATQPTTGPTAGGGSTAGSGSTAGAATAASDNGAGSGSTPASTGGSGSTDASGATGGSGSTATATAPATTTSTAPPTTDTPTSTTTTTPGTPTDTSTGVSPDPSATAPPADATPTAPITIPTGTATQGSDSTPVTSTPTGTTGSSVGSSADGSSAAQASAPSAAAPTAQQSTTGTTDTTDTAPVVVTDPSTGGPSTESTGSADQAVPADPTPVTTESAPSTEKAADPATETAPAAS